MNLFNKANEIWLKDKDLGYRPSQQILAASQVINRLKNTHYCRLQAQMQSGKTGVIAIAASVALKMGMFNKVIFITGESSTNLKDQNEFDVLKILKAYDIKNLSDTFEVYHRGEFTKKSIEKKLKTPQVKTLLIIDESHSGAGKDGVLHLIRRHLKASLYKKGQTKILTVSATPFPEAFVEELQKFKAIELTFSDKYLSVEKMMNLGLIKQSEKAYSEEMGISQLLLTQLKSFKKSKKETCIIRSSELANNPEILYGYINKNDFHIEVVDQTTEKNLEYFVSNGDNRTKKIIILLKQKGRVGVQIKTDKLYFVWDNPKQKTSTTAQSLLGRVCGYNKSKNNVKVFTDLEEAERYIKWTKGELDDISYTLGKSRAVTMKDYKVFPVKEDLLKLKKAYNNDVGSRSLFNYDQGAGFKTYEKLVRGCQDLKPKNMAPLGLQQGGARPKSHYYVSLNMIGNSKKAQALKLGINIKEVNGLVKALKNKGYKAIFCKFTKPITKSIISGKRSMYED